MKTCDNCGETATATTDDSTLITLGNGREWAFRWGSDCTCGKRRAAQRAAAATAQAWGPHTPGPWRAKDTRVMTSEGNHVADCDTSRVIPDEERHGNARLIAAAPQLLAALEAINEAGRMSNHPRARYCAEIAEDALEALNSGDE